MSVAPTPHRTRTSRRSPVPLPLTALLAAALAGGAVVVAAPASARAWVAVTVCVAWLGVASTAGAASATLRRRRGASDAASGELRTLRARSAQLAAESAHLLNVTVPAVVKRLRDGATVEDALTGTPGPKDAQLRRMLEAFATEVGAAEHRARASAANCAAAVRQLALAADGVDRMTTVALPAAVAHLRTGASAETVMAGLDRPADSRLRVLLETTVRELALSERRAAAAQGASAKALSRVQAKAVTMLADLREMQDRHGEEVFGDLLKLDHNASQLGLMTDRLALLMGGRASRAWNKPIPMESVLRGAVGRIAAYQRVRLHSSSTAAVVGFAAEGVMHLLAELMDNGANFSPPVDEVHVYVEERTAGLVVTIEDSGLRMSDAAMRRAEEAVSGRVTDLATLQGTRLGLAVVGRLAVKYRMSVSFRPSSRGGTGVVVLLPPQLLAQPRNGGPEQQATGHVTPAHGLTVPLPDAPTTSGAGTAGTPSWDSTAAATTTSGPGTAGTWQATATTPTEPDTTGSTGTTSWDSTATTPTAGPDTVGTSSWDSTATSPAGGPDEGGTPPWNSTAAATTSGPGRVDTWQATAPHAAAEPGTTRTTSWEAPAATPAGGPDAVGATSGDSTAATTATEPDTTRARSWDSTAAATTAGTGTAGAAPWEGTAGIMSAAGTAGGSVPVPPQGVRRVATPGGLPVRPAGRTMAAADRGRDAGAGPSEGYAGGGRDAGTQFGAFHRSRRPPASSGSPAADTGGPSFPPESPAPTDPHGDPSEEASGTAAP
ncbi:ATP-binding protein [Streptomyces kurssanovii]|uniref:histidine kinase n=1 Tax=Streptomyces kurssanovii TaxID=67312 RepID=A0ABV3HW34_9ACTN